MSPTVITAAQLWAAIIAAFAAIFGWFISHQLTTRREDRTRRLQIEIAQTEKQIGELYAPLIFLVEQLLVIAEFKDKFDKLPNKDDLGKIARLEYFVPLHDQINSILMNKIYLIEGDRIPQVIVDYYKHYASEKIAWQMSYMEIHDIFDHVKPYPKELLFELQKHKAELHKRHKLALEELRHVPNILYLFSAPSKGAVEHNE